MKTIIKIGMIIALAMLVDLILIVLPLALIADAMWIVKYFLYIFTLEVVITFILIMLWSKKN